MKALHNPVVRITLSLTIIILFIVVASQASGNSPFSIILIFLGAVAGPYMFLTYPFGILAKVGYSLSLVFSLSLIVWGTKKNKQLKGQAAVIMGICVWCLLGLIGLGTGT